MTAAILATFTSWTLLGAIVAVIARDRGRSALGWWLYGVFLLPVALVHVLRLDRGPGAQVEMRLLDASRGQPGLTVRELAEQLRMEASQAVTAARGLRDRHLARFESDDQLAVDRGLLLDARMYAFEEPGRPGMEEV